MFPTPLRHKYVKFQVALMLDRQDYSSTIDYRVGDFIADLYVQRPFEQPFVVQVLARKDEEHKVAPNEKLRKRLSEALCAPVYFAIVQQREGQPNLVELESFLIPKVLYGDDLVVSELALRPTK